jgi:hypothetical protein
MVRVKTFLTVGCLRLFSERDDLEVAKIPLYRVEGTVVGLELVF